MKYKFEERVVTVSILTEDSDRSNKRLESSSPDVWVSQSSLRIPIVLTSENFPFPKRELIVSILTEDSDRSNFALLVVQIMNK